MTKKNKLLIGFISFIIITLIIILCLYSYNNSEVANAADLNDVNVINFSNDYSFTSSFPYVTNPVFYNSSSAIIQNNRTYTGNASWVTISEGFNLNFQGYTTNNFTISPSSFNVVSNGTTYNIPCVDVVSSQGFTALYFRPFENNSLKNTSINFYINIGLSGTFDYVYLDTSENGSYTSYVNCNISGNFTGGVSYHYSLPNTSNNYFYRLRIKYSANSHLKLSGITSNMPNAFVLNDSVTYINNTTTYSGNFTDNGSGAGNYRYGTRIPFNFGASVTTDNAYKWNLDYFETIVNSFSPIFICTMNINGSIITFPLSQGQPHNGVSDVRYVCLVGTFVRGNYTYNINFYNCNYEGKDYQYNFVIDLFNSYYNSYSITSFRLDRYDNAFNSYSYERGYNTGYSNALITLERDKNTAYSNGYNIGYTDGLGLAQNGTFLMLLTSVVEAPFRAFLDILDFEILGYNMKAFLGALISIALALFVIRMILNGSTKNG